MSQAPLLYSAPSFYTVLQENGFSQYNPNPDVANATCSLQIADRFKNISRSKKVIGICQIWFYSIGGVNTQNSVKIYDNRISISDLPKNDCIANYLYYAKDSDDQYIFGDPYPTDDKKLVYSKSPSSDRSYLNNIYFSETMCSDCYNRCTSGGNPSETKKPKSTYKCTEQTIVYKKKERRIWVKDDKSYIKRMQTKNGKRQAIYTRVWFKFSIRCANTPSLD